VSTTVPQPGLPLDVEALTAEWFAWALDSDVTAVELLDQHSGTTGRARVALRGDKNVPATAFVKLAPFDESQREFVNSVGMGVSEARFYRDLAGELPVRVPRSWFSEYDDDTYVMVLEDLEASGCRFPAPDDDDIEFRARDIAEQLAALHAPYWNSDRFDAGGDLEWLAHRGTGQGDGGAPFIQIAADQLADRLPDEFRRMAEFYVARARDIAALWNAGPRTLVHGDPHLGNLFVDEQAASRTGFLDWAMVGRSPGVRDLAYVMCSSVPGEVRRTNERAIVERYCELLAEGGVTLPFDDAWQQYRLFAVYGWVAATATAAMGSKWQPLHIGLAGTERATRAITDLDALGLLESLLA
jgi:aminoglycoside phosphotransferase (APT) family kinase protein